ncbi:hypothetical protein ACN20G_32195 (plasmid) [Streptomyces sp. BI20]|uniref:hypothetical protein n=1 Tax=Streptomyces sp. BI20 TaxID=3403460 RepID=UPI003C74BE38
MKLKRMTVVAAAAMAGPTVLMASPAMASEIDAPAVSVPDAAPKDDSAPAPASESKKLEADPRLTLAGVPKSLTPGEWQEMTLEVDNSKGKAHKGYVYGVGVKGVPRANVQVEAFGVGGVNAWVSTAFLSGDIVTPGGHYAMMSTGKLGAGEQTSMKVRVKVTAESGNLTLQAAGLSEKAMYEQKAALVSAEYVLGIGAVTPDPGDDCTDPGEDTKPPVTDPDPEKPGPGDETKPPVTDPDPGTDPGTDPEKPGPGDETKPPVTPDPEKPGPGEETKPPVVNPGDELADTGAGRATSWALGAGGVAIALGAAFVAGNGKRRRSV